MFHKKKFILNEKKKEKQMYSAKSAKWLKYLIILALTGFVLLIILANVRSKSYYQNLNSANKSTQKVNSRSRSMLSLKSVSINCKTISCSVTCSGDMTDLNKYLDTQKSCASLTLRISDYSFPDDRLQRNWLTGSFNLKLIQLTGGILSEIESGAFDQKTTANVMELELKAVQLQTLTEDTFVGLSSMQTFTLINQIEIFSGNGFLKPMSKTLEKVVIKHVTSTAAGPAAWLRGEHFPKLITIVLDGSNLGSYVTGDTFLHLTELQILTMNSCKITAIADGAFDFMMRHSVVLVSLQKNKLKHLAGSYLTKVSPLQRVDIQYNPWDCNCELEDLIREYKRYPDGFGGQAECSTPSGLMGKSLKDVDVESCASTTTISTTLSPSTPRSTTSFTTTPPKSTLSSTTELLPASSTADPNSSTSKTTTELDPTSSTADPNSSTSKTTTELDPTSSTADPNSSTSETTTILPPTVTSTTSTEILPNSSPPTTVFPTSFGSSSYSTTHPTTSIDNEITSMSSQTTPSTQNRSTTVSFNLITIECQRHTTGSASVPGFNVELLPPDTAFDIIYLSATCAQLVMETPTDDLGLIWFYDQPNTTGTGESIQIVGEFKIGCQSDVENSLTIEGLVENRAYTFCLVKEGVQVISPFNCRSYFTHKGAASIDDSRIWLKCEDKALTISLFVLGIVISMCIGLVGMFLVLRSYPALLKGNKRVIVVNRSTGDVLIMPKTRKKTSITESSYRNSFNTSTTIHQRRFSETSIQSGRSYMVANNYEDIEYRWKMNVVNDMIYANRVPKSPPPPLPKRASKNSSLYNESADKTKVSVVQQKGNDYGYIS